MQNCMQILKIEARSSLESSEVLEVLSFSEKEIKLKLKGNVTMLINGNMLRIVCFDESSQKFTLKGEIESVRYKKFGENLIKRALK